MTPGLEAGSREILGGNKAIDSLPFSNRRGLLHLASSAERVGRESERLTRGIMRFWMERITGYGFARIPRPRGRVPLRVGQAVRANPASPILCRKFNDDLVISANGRSIAISNNRNVVELIRALNRGKAAGWQTCSRQASESGSGRRGVFGARSCSCLTCGRWNTREQQPALNDGLR